MIIQYYRPQTLDEALKLLLQPNTQPLGGGTLLTQGDIGNFSVVDLQALGLDKIKKNGNMLEIGATATLQSLVDSPYTPAALKHALEIDSPLNLRNQGTVAGALVSCNGRSPFGTTLLALDANCSLVSADSIPAGTTVTIRLGDLLPFRDRLLRGKLIISIEIPLNTRQSFESVARTPADRPILCAALSQWPSGRTRLALGGWGSTPSLAMDGNEPGDIQAAAANVCSEAGDEWASTEYRMEIARVLSKRCLETAQHS
jgi:CO/xanthine dehydrogenase FAD-binding subunit